MNQSQKKWKGKKCTLKQKLEGQMRAAAAARAPIKAIMLTVPSWASFGDAFFVVALYFFEHSDSATSFGQQISLSSGPA